jgi:hypothetical protein
MWFQKELPYPDLDLNQLKATPNPMNTDETLNKLLGTKPQKYFTGKLTQAFTKVIDSN